jgi:hypothetical protein
VPRKLTKPMTMKKSAPIIVILLLLMSCEKHNNTCDCDNPLVELTWLSNLKNSLTNCFCETSIIQASYMKQTVFYVAVTDDLCNTIFEVTILDCSGNIVKNYKTVDTFTNEVTGQKVLYRCRMAK